MSDETVSQPDDGVSRAEYENLQEQLKAVKADRDQQSFEKSQIVAKANDYAKERDELKEELASVLAERDQMIGDVVAEHDKLVADLTSQRDQLAREKGAVETALQEATRKADDANRQFVASSMEIQRLRDALDAKPSTDPFELLLDVLADRTKQGVAWVRNKIPADSPVLPYFDKTVETVTRVGCLAIKLTKEFIAWATPRVIALSKQGMAKVEELLAKK
ncbi:hypothetical protein [Methylocystis parvus]|uniref:Uncharacterized protein n=1 Tax=Methylocystis parvus TaxID=134 RepID=A0A6B8M7M6_9HYPH|nr:hypothetical protein [Methylocystis parvus]QGM98395.1 hypothetical protein F7D14_13515 [Methylocystis parvus]WBK01272.1 hypothetical protein MMG94_06050 [Methylocystis parvus OBBP]